MSWELAVIGLGAVGMALGLIVWKSGSAQRKLKKQARRALREERRSAKALDEARNTPLPDDDALSRWSGGVRDEDDES